MKKLLLALLLIASTACYAGGPMSSGAQFSDPVPIEHGGTNAVGSTAARTNLGVYSTDEVDSMIAAGELLYYTTGSASADVAGMRRFATSSADLALLTEWASDTAAINNNGVYYLIASYITPAGFPGVTAIRQGVYSSHSHAYISSGNRDVKMEIELWLYDSAGTPKTFIATSSEEDIPSSNDGFAITFSVQAAVSCDVTDRLVWRVYVESISGTNATVVRLYTGGSKSTYFGVPVSNEQVCTVATPQTISNKTFSDDTEFLTSVTTPIVDTPSGAPLVLRSGGAALLTVDPTIGPWVATFTMSNASMTYATVYLSASQTMNYNGREIVQWNAEYADPAAIFNGATATIRTNGVYDIDVHLAFYNLTADPGESSWREVGIYVNDVGCCQQSDAAQASMTTTVPTIHLSTRNIPLKAGDTVTAKVYNLGIPTRYALYADTAFRRNWMTITQVR